MSYLFGCDPELFVHDGARYVPAYNMIPGTKDAPHKVRNGAVQVDGLALEFNIDPVATREDWLLKIRDVQGQMADMIDPKYKLLATPSANFNRDEFINLPPAAKQLGCDPDFNAYTNAQNAIEENAGDEPYRCAGGHIHIGWAEPDASRLKDQVHMEDCRVVVRALDKTLAFLSVNFDKDRQRARLYGQRGAHRVKPYGVEYRTLSNAWIDTDERVNWAFDTTKLTLEILEKDHKFFGDFDGYDRDYVYQDYIHHRRCSDSYYRPNITAWMKRLEGAGFNTKVA